MNRCWTLALEVAVLAHGTLVAIMQGKGMWPMFAFGFGGIFAITRMHGLGWPRPVRALVPAAYVAGVAAVYAPLGWDRLNECCASPDRLRRRVRPRRNHRWRPRPDPPLRGTDPIGERAVRGLSRGLSDRRPEGVGQTLVVPLQSCR